MGGLVVRAGRSLRALILPSPDSKWGALLIGTITAPSRNPRTASSISVEFARVRGFSFTNQPPFRAVVDDRPVLAGDLGVGFDTSPKSACRRPTPSWRSTTAMSSPCLKLWRRRQFGVDDIAHRSAA
jgi:hypothetical protein